MYSAVLHTKPDRLLIVTSVAAKGRVAEALSQAGCSKPYHLIELGDPHLGYGEVDDHLGSHVDEILAAAGSVVANVTGGTTVMQHAVERIASRARRLGAKVRCCAMVDRAPPRSNG